MPKGRLKAVFYSECFACYSILYVVHLNRSLVGLLGVVIEKTDVASQVVPLRSCKKKHFKLLAEIQKLKLILFCREPVFQVGLSRFQKPIKELASVYHR